VFQDPLGSLNPVHSVGRQLREVLRLHRGLDAVTSRRRSLELMSLVGIPEPELRLGSYPHQLSGGMAQRVMIAMALACEPDLLIADEPTTALDVTIQAQILDLLQRLKSELSMSILFVTHDLGVVAQMADDVVVMRHGQVVESGSLEDVFLRPRAAYTRELLGAAARLDDPAPVYRAGAAQ
jgi:ABC-type dipeptide/oligopeptide/nickel transport system ATPase component